VNRPLAPSGPPTTAPRLPLCCGEKGVRLAQKMEVGPHILLEIQLQRAEVGPASGLTWRLSHLRRPHEADDLDLQPRLEIGDYR
jgi:hypothetical protein